ncbi:MAG: hypothetical protein QOF83_4282 [Solirubrobacteraceae bacterium]|jgi:hypothetical protein|nr:hypothetical protein [Solirubrobacteraceae bacterium]
MTEPTEVTIALAVIDATLAGDAVEPEYAELAELSLILAADRETPSAAFAAELDGRAARRFAGAPPAASPGEKRRRWQWLLAPGLAVGLAALVAVVFVFGGGATHSIAPTPSATDLSGAARGSQVQPRRPANLAASSSSASSARDGRLQLFGPNNGAAAAAGVHSPAPTPSTTGRQIVQSAQLALSTRPSQVDDVAQQVFDVVAAQNGVVQNSNVTATKAYGNAQFTLSVPSANLAKTLNALSQLRGANVVSRSDATQDITGQVGGAGRRLAEARALRTSLLRQLAAATTATAVSSLKTQIRDVDASISSDLASLRSLQRKVAFSQISVTINSVSVPVTPVTGSGGGFTLSRAVHDAGRVLVVAAGVALIALAVLVPLGLLVALGLWVAAALRRRRREQALDLI